MAANRSAIASKVTRQDGSFIFAWFDSNEYTRKVYEFLKLLAILVMWTYGQTERGTEMLGLLYHNKLSAGRNISILDGQVMMTARYHKCQSIMDKEKV
jgi:hypothetical protein